MAEATTIDSPPVSSGAGGAGITVDPGTQKATDKGPALGAPKPGSARARMFEDMRKIARPPGADTTTPTPRQTRQAPPLQTQETQETQETETTEQGQETQEETQVTQETQTNEQTTEQTQTGTKDKAKRPNPWKVIDEWKGKYALLEKQIAESKNSTVNPKEKEEWAKRVETAEKRAQELEQEIIYVNYSKSQEFQEKYQKPYEASWARAMKELGELTIESENGERAFSPQDMMELVNLSMPKARALAEEKYGSFANDVMNHRKEIRTMFEQQANALEEARTKGLERTKKQQEEWTKRNQELSENIKSSWQKVNDSIVKDEKYGKFFTPREGNEHWNQRLAKGFELVDRAYGENPANPNLTPEQREGIIKRHAAVRNRAAAFGAVSWENQQLTAKLAELEKELAQYKGSTPPSGGNTRAVGVVQGGSAKDQVFGALRKYAK